MQGNLDKPNLRNLHSDMHENLYLRGWNTPSLQIPQRSIPYDKDFFGLVFRVLRRTVDEYDDKFEGPNLPYRSTPRLKHYKPSLKDFMPIRSVRLFVQHYGLADPDGKILDSKILSKTEGTGNISARLFDASCAIAQAGIESGVAKLV